MGGVQSPNDASPVAMNNRSGCEGEGGEKRIWRTGAVKIIILWRKGRSFASVVVVLEEREREGRNE